MIFSGENDSLTYARTISSEADGIIFVSTVFRCKKEIELIRIADVINVDISKPEYIWTSSLAPEEDDVVGDHAFRSPAIILQNQRRSISLIPDLDSLKKIRKPDDQLKMFMALNGDKISIGFAEYECRPHVYYRLTHKPVTIPAGHTLKINYYLLCKTDVNDPMNVRNVLSFLWETYASEYLKSELPKKLSFDTYAEVSYNTVFSTGDFAEFETSPGNTRGGFRTCSARDSSDIESSYFRIPSCVVWFHSWFNSLRTAFGLKYYANQWGNSPYSEKADSVKELVLDAPDFLENGLIPAVYDYENRQWWCGVPRLGAGKEIFDLTATAHTAQWMLLWNRFLEGDSHLLERTEKIVNCFLKLQDKNGSFPGYMDKTGNVLDLLRYSGHSGMISLLLCEFFEESKDHKVLDAILDACDFYISEIIPQSKFHDFETFFSCSEKPLDFYDKRTGQNAQNNLSLYWITESLIRAYSFTENKTYLKWGLHCLDRLSLYQQVWNPPYISLYTFGGFGVMNTDGEWNDTRQVYFSDTYFLVYKLTGTEEYLQRGIAALRAGCALICHPEHQDINPLRYNFFPDGFAPESFAHGGTDGTVHRSGFDWGAGALATMSALTKLKHPDIILL